ncbi:MAG TPA: CoA transferase [Steroidobacteraceae bacterium]|nr:CoA transferase [Steroidobacteraceae bacterium]
MQHLARASRSAAFASLDGTTLLGERAMRAGLTIPGRTSAGAGCRLYDALGDTVALNLARPADRELLPALFETDELDPNDASAIAAHIARIDAKALVSRGRSMGLAIAAEHEMAAPAGSASELSAPSGSPACVELACGCPTSARKHPAPRVIDLSALWAGPLAAHLLWLAGAEVIKVESRSRPDAMRDAEGDFYALINQGKACVGVDLADPIDRQALLSLIALSDIVIEAARPRALMQHGIDADQIVHTTSGLVWISITAHGSRGEAAGWVGFGDDCGVAAGLSAALRSASGRSGFVGDAIADPLTGLFAALAAWEAWESGGGARLGLAMTQVVARCLDAAREADPDALRACLIAWAGAVGKPFPTVTRRSIGPAPAFGGDLRSYVAQLAR